MVGINFEDWEQRKLGELCFIGDIDHRMPKSVSVGIPYVMTGDFIGNNDIDFDNAKLISEKDYERFSQKIKPEEGNILFARYASVGTVRYVESKRKFLISYSCAILKPNKDVNGKYVFYYLQTGVAQQRIEMEINTGSQRNIGIDSLKNNIVISVPKINEQLKIVAFLTKLDDTIALHQDKLEKLNQLRNGYLQIIFPQKDEKTPHLRFANFSSDWEKRKLEDLATFSKGSGYTKSDLVEEGTPIILYGRLYTKYQTIIEHVDTFVKMKEKSVLSEGDEVIVPSSGESSEDIARASVVATADILLGGDLNIIKTISDINSTFLALNISNGKQQKELSKKAQGKSVVHLRNSDLKKIDLTYPVVEVQIQIGNFFKQLDHTITLQHNKTEKLKQLKKFYLQKLFV